MGQIFRFVFSMEIVRAIRQFVPWIGRTFLSIARFMGMAIFTFWRNVPSTSDQIAKVWQRNAIDAGFPREYDRALYQILWVLAFAMLVLGWIVCAFVTIWLIGVIL